MNRDESHLWRASRWGTIVGLVVTLLAVPTLASSAKEAPAPVPPGDEEIELAVERQFARRGGIPSSRLDVSVANGVVMLTGTVDHLMARDRAVWLAKAVRGVVSVVDRTKVRPADRPDARVAEAVREAFRRDPATLRYPVEVSVEKGTVTLEGTVPSVQLKQLYERVARSVSGVRETANELRVHVVENRPDAEIRDAIREHLEWDVGVDASSIDVAVRDGDVTLSGEVRSVHELDRARDRCWVPGVRSVETGRLAVLPWKKPKMVRKADYTRSDSAIAEAIRRALSMDPRVSAFDIDVRVDRGRAVLTGAVDHPAARTAAGRDARNTWGVWSVENLLKIRLDAHVSGPELLARVTKAVRQSPFLSVTDIELSVKKGWVLLKGTVRNRFERIKASETVSRVAGVEGVWNRLEVKPEGNGSYYWSPVTGGHVRESDATILRNVRRAFRWSPFVDEERLRVEVENGVVTLSGTVSHLLERETALRHALRSGASAVRDRTTRREEGPSVERP